MKNKVKIIIPKVQKYHLTYKNQKNQVKEYLVSPPIEADDEKMTVYAFGSGIRSFRLDRIVDLK